MILGSFISVALFFKQQLLSICYDHRGTRLNVMNICWSLQLMLPPKPNVLTFPPPVLLGGCSKGLDALHRVNTKYVVMFQ